MATGDATEVVSHGEFLDLLTMLAKLKKHREARGLSLSDAAERSGMDRSAISRLENGQYLNPTVDTLYRYARSIGAEIGFSVRTG
jgi:transcriptional regulator with XRE-family HTH domain